MIVDAISGFISGAVKPILDKFVPDAKDRLEAENMLLKGIMAADLRQMEINKAEAQHPNWFVAGWRPAIGWSGAVALAYTALGYPILVWASTNFGWTPPPEVNVGSLTAIVTGMLGLGTMRSWEKKQGIARN